MSDTPDEEIIHRQLDTEREEPVTMIAEIVAELEGVRHDELKTNTRLDTAGLSVGGGLQIRDFRFDYAFNSWLENGNLHQFTVRTTL